MKETLKFWGVLIGLLWLAGASWDAALEADPADTDPVSAGAGEIRDTRAETRHRAETDLCWGSFDTDGCPAGDEGRLREGGARAFHDTASPSALNAADRPGSTALDEGRLWADSDTPSATVHRLQVYDGSGWEDVEAGYAAALTDATDSDDQILAGSHNLVYNGGFEATDGTGLASSTTVPAGWTVSNATIAYTDPSGDVRWGDGYHVDVTATAGNGYIQLSLPNLAASSVFKVIARARDDATTVCTVDVTNEGGTAFVADSTGTDAWETVSGTFGTAATVDTVEIQLITVTSGQQCEWDHVSIQQVGDTTTDRDEVNYGDGAIRVRAEYAGAAIDCNGVYTGTCGSAATGLTVTVNPPAPGYIVLVSGSINAEVGFDTNASSGCEARLHDGSVAIDEATLVQNSGTSSGNNPEVETHLKLSGSTVNPTPGTPIVYTLDMIESNTECQLETTFDSWIEAVLIPTR